MMTGDFYSMNGLLFAHVIMVGQVDAQVVVVCDVSIGRARILAYCHAFQVVKKIFCFEINILLSSAQIANRRTTYSLTDNKQQSTRMFAKSTFTVFLCGFVCCQLISGYPIGILEASSSTPPADEVLKAKEMADIVMQSYVDGFNNDAYAEQPIHRTESTDDDDDETHATTTHLPGAISKDQESRKRPSETSTVDSSQANVVTVNEEESTDYIADPLYDPVTSSNVIMNVETKLNDTFPPVQSFDSESLVLVEKSASTNAENDRLGFLDPGSITLTLIIVVAVICLVSLISLSVLMIWQYRRRHNSHQWVVNKSIPPAYQSDAWCYESASHDDTLKKRGSIYLSGASLKPYAYADSLPTSNGTTRSTIFPDSAEPSPVDSRRDHSWSSNDEMIEIVARQNQAHRTPPYREKLVN
ncbi:hypothetical protein T07_13297 [Trichinella nelsoni]|uniref:Uncharacterized protein n=1 Tax=Trichinella nelsoni TaxID=6336 RepID=A0A0V0SAF6_9BILA|nr:hypothetical protein T07_13297 [Trichinella nelsoni]